MLKFEKETGETLALGIKGVSAKQIDELNRIENVTLSGKLHVQIIGEPSYYMEFEVLCNGEQVDKINEAYANGERLRLIKTDGVFKGLIKEIPEFKRFGRLKATKLDTKYTAGIVFSILEDEA